MKMIKQWQKLLAMALLAGVFAFMTGQASAQNDTGGRRGNRGNFDPAQMRQGMMDRIREAFEVKSDDEWKVLEGRISKVMDAQRDTRMGVGFGGFRGPRRGGDNNNGGGDQNQNARRNAFGGEPTPEAEALQKALEAKAGSDEIKSKLAKFRDARRAKEAALEKAQEDLRKVLTVRQEATAVTMGLLK